MSLQCPQCHSTITFNGPTPREFVCDSCGSTIQHETQATADWLPAQAPKRLGKFEFLEQLGMGAFGAVYKARDSELDRLVAIKIPRRDILPQSQDMERFLREAKSAAQLKHPGIVSLYDAGMIDNTLCLVSEFIQGSTLAERLSAKRFDIRQAAEFVAEAANALQYAHQQGVIHRDIKPSNIMVDLEGCPHLMDFGLAKRAAEEITMTLEGQLLGTPAYMSPEQARGNVRQVDARSDIYSLGVVLYELLTGQLPFAGERRMLLVQVIQDEPRPPRRLNDQIPRDLETICLKTMAKEPARRYATAGELANDLRRYLNGEPIVARPIGRATRTWRWCRRNPRAAMLTGSVALLLILLAAGSTVAALWLKQERDSARAAEDRARNAKENALDSERRRRQELFRAYIGEARASRTSGRPGQRENGLSAIRNILAALPPEELTEEQRWQLSDEAVACLALTDLRELSRRPNRSHSSKVIDLAPDLAYAVETADDPGGTLVSDAASGNIVRRLSSPNAAQFPISLERSLDASGRWLLEVRIRGVAGETPQLRVWDRVNAKIVVDRPVTTDPWPAFLPDGRRLLFAGGRGSIIVYDLIAGKQERESPSRFFADRVSVAPDGKRAAVAGRDRPAEIINLDTWKTIEIVPDAGAATVAVWCPAGVSGTEGREMVVFGNVAGGLYLWYPELHTGHLMVAKHAGAVNALCLSPDGAYLASSSDDNHCTLRKLHGDIPLFTLPGRVVRFSRDSRRLAVATNRELALFEIVGGRTCVSHRISTDSVEFSPDGRWLAIGGIEGASLLDAHSLHNLAHLDLDSCGPVGFHPGGREFVTYGLFSYCWRWPFHPPDAAVPGRIGPPRPALPKNPLSNVFLQPQHFGRHAVWSPDGKFLVVSDSRKGQVWLAEENKSGSPRLLANMDGVGRVAVSPDSRWVAGADVRNTGVKVWDKSDGRVVHEIPGCGHVVFSSDGRWLAAGWREAVHLYRTDTWRLEREFRRHEANDTLRWPIAFQPNGRLIAFSPSRGHVRLCDCESGRMVANLNLPDFEEITWLSFSPDGTRLAVAAGAPVIWDLHELRAGLLDLGLDADGLPERSVPLPHRRSQFVVERGSELPPPIKWSQNWLNLAKEDEWRGKFAEAISDATSAIRALPWGATPADRAQILAVRGRYQLANGNPWAARADWQEALTLAPDLPDPATRLARLYVLGVPELRDPKRAVVLLTSLSRDEDLPQSEQALLGMAYVQSKQIEMGLSILNKVSASEFQSHAAYFRAVALHKLGRMREARDLLAKAKTAHDAVRESLKILEREELDRLRSEAEKLVGRD